MYYKISFSNGYYGCDEEIYEEFDTEKEAEEWANEYLTGGMYGFYEPDDRFIGNEDDYESEEEYLEAYEEYQENCTCFIKEITKEEYVKNINKKGVDK